MEELNEHLKERAEQLIIYLQLKNYLLSEADEMSNLNTGFPSYFCYRHLSDLLEGRYTISNNFNNYLPPKLYTPNQRPTN